MRIITLFQRIIGFFGLIALTVLFVTCQDGLQVQEQKDKATVSFSVTDGTERTVLPYVSLADVASYELLGGRNGEAETVLAESFTGTGTSVPLDPGTWNFTLNGYNNSDEHILQGKVQNKQITLTGTNQVNFSLSVINSGTGSIQITINFPETAGITRISTNGDIASEEFNGISDGSFVYTKNGIAAGDFFINFELYRGDILRTVISELVLVRGNLTSSATITLIGDDLKPLLSGTVSIAGTAVVGETLTANTSGINGIGTIAYQWNRNETPIPGANNSTYTVEIADLYTTITVTVTRDGYVGSITSNPTITILTFLTGTVSITGTAQAGQTLTANIADLGGSGTITYQWIRGITNVGTNSSTYALQLTDVGSIITLTITRADNFGSITSAPTTAVVVPEGYMRQPYYYPGTGTTYNGYSGTEGTLTISGGVTVTYPAETTFSADGFFTLEGSVNNPASYNYAIITLTKDSDPSNLTTSYFVRDNFEQRIWLRFGAGAYTVGVHGLSSLSVNTEGFIYYWSYYGSAVTFSVTNTRNEGDQRFIYPSGVIQSDDLLVTTLAAELTDGLTSDADKIKAIHDYIVANTIYDYDSLEDGYRKKQDALTVLGTRYSINSAYPHGHFLAVCEGYATTAAALLRAVGIETKYIHGMTTSSDDISHAWNHVYIGGSWKFLDVTWDDPNPDTGPNSVSYRYYLLADLGGINNDHYDYYVDNSRSTAPIPVIPKMRGMPDGWY